MFWVSAAWLFGVSYYCGAFAGLTWAAVRSWLIPLTCLVAFFAALAAFLDFCADAMKDDRR
jgi:hypothetical protein